ncbi:hypothetical protein [Ramlibacter alkalitolerans]|uniref:Uncharacterized protein n=1 Tax=Ramlibacter alkalitolerans TaxID=2039631 RepID=A0ABS1JSJ6_9BURK|nr:hypothetical protein [Ramlibacter alkalitolerans]MBL0426826.1 hypothetical protein [Ramlibacter alkalitolerans]
MRENRRAVAAALALACLPFVSLADEASDGRLQPCCNARVDAYRNFTRQLLANCSRWVEVRYRESISIVNAQKLSGCIATGMQDSRLQLEAALRGVRRKAARSALRSYQISFESALAGVAPTTDEPAAAYDQRQSSLRHQLAHAWTRFELEES